MALILVLNSDLQLNLPPCDICWWTCWEKNWVLALLLVVMPVESEQTHTWSTELQNSFKSFKWFIWSRDQAFELWLFFSNSWPILKNGTSLLSSTTSGPVSLLQHLLTQEWFWFYLSKGAGIEILWLPLLSRTSHSHPVSSLLLSLIYPAANTSILLGWEQHTSALPREAGGHRRGCAASLILNPILQEREHPGSFTVRGCAFIFNLTVTLQHKTHS